MSEFDDNELDSWGNLDEREEEQYLEDHGKIVDITLRHLRAADKRFKTAVKREQCDLEREESKNVLTWIRTWMELVSES